MYLTERSQSTLNGINAYNNFGLREEFLSVYLTEGIAFSDTAKLNKRKQVPAAKAWFRQGLLMDPKTTQPTRLLNLFERRGLKDRQAWDCVWLGLSNYAPIVKWLVCTLQFDTSYSDVELFELLGTDIKEVTKKGGLQALKNMLASTPFGNNSGGVCELHKQQGQRTAITRRAHSVDPLTMLYGLFVMANRAGRNAFTVRAMLSAELEDAFVSPLVAFGISPDEFKKQCMGLAARYPDYLTCSFTLGLDEVVVKTDEKTLDDVVGLLLEQ